MPCTAPVNCAKQKLAENIKNVTVLRKQKRETADVITTPFISRIAVLALGNDAAASAESRMH